MATPQSSHSTTEDTQSKDFDDRDAALLEHVAEKLVWYGRQVGVTPEVQ